MKKHTFTYDRVKKIIQITMKKLIIIVMLFNIANAATKKNLKEQLNDCEVALQKCLNSPDLYSSEPLPCVMNKNALKAIKQSEKTKRKAIASDKHTLVKELEVLKDVVKVENRTERKQSDNKVKTNFVFQLFSSFKSFLRSLNISQALGLGGGVVGLGTTLLGLGEKLKPIDKIVGLFKKE